MSSPDNPPSDPVHSELAALAQRVDRLLDTVRRLTEENRSLRHSQEQLSGERAGLLARNEQARSRVEAMIQRLKSLESNG
jgi:cell division protein ZapB